jgi:site-specific recombinase XerD
MNEHFKNKGYVFLSQVKRTNAGIPQHWKMSSRTVSKHIERMKTFFKFALDFNWIKTDPARPIAIPKVEDSEAAAKNNRWRRF